ncbi:MAG: LptF/LptG family permease [Paludibacteraceae bacterium]|nr:LptF/LptG family permease [Paludibacteraceae bacterium]
MQLKRLHTFLLKDYLLSFLATFFVCLFILLMQSLWRYIDEMVGKGLELTVLAQFFYYAALSLVPMALPLAILLSSLMSFGGLGERLELIAMKAAGISLFRIMKPYIVVIALLSVGSFYFSNVVMPDVQLKWTVLLRSIKHKSPDVSIPVGSFYTGIENYSIYVRSKNHDTKMLYDMMIYDFSGTAGGGGSDNIRIVTADSGMLVSTADKKGFILKLHSGEMFENMKGSEVQVSRKNIPFRRETFEYRELIMDYDNSLNMVSEESVSNKQSTKNLDELTASIDSLQRMSDSMAVAYSHKYVNSLFFGRTLDSGYVKANLDTIPQEMLKSYQTMINRRTLMQLKESCDRAVNKMQNVRNELDYFGDRKLNTVDKVMWKHNIEWHRKFTLSFACFIFFFIGAPLGAIIRKGGFGLPVVISIVLFIIYYIVDNTGFKMARNGGWPVWAGTWLSSAMLFPLGLFLTYKAAIDATFNMPTVGALGKNISNFFKKLFAKLKRSKDKPEII